jgi:uncharacterized protein (DUF4415 family)
MVIKIRGAATVSTAVPKVAKRKLEELKKAVEKPTEKTDPARDDGKQPVTIRLDAEIIRFFKASGPGWQTRINSILRREAGLENPVEKFGPVG